jgi:uncharacterized membrane protein
MKNTLLFALVFLLLLSQAGFSKSYSYDSIKTNLDFYSDGSVIVRQERDYNFVGSFSYAYLDIIKKGAGDVKFLGITDLDTNESLTYDLQEDSTHTKATWYYTANYQIKRFLIVYKIEGVVKRYQDVAEFYWKVIEDTHESIDKLDSYINLPTSSSNLFKVFVHSSASPGELTFDRANKTATVSMQNIPKDTFVEFRVLTEPSLFGDVNQIGYKNYENILSEEKLTFFSSFFSNNQFIIVVILSMLPIFAFIYFYMKYGRDPKVEYEVTYEHEPPGKVPPMALSNLLEGEEEHTNIKREAMGMLATIFDLARRDYLEVREEKKKRFLGLGEKTDQIFILTKKGRGSLKSLENFERSILKFLFSLGSEEGRVTSSDIVKECKRNPYFVKGEIDKFDKQARNWFERKYFPITEKVSREKRNRFIFIISTYLAVVFILTIFTFSFYMFMLPLFVCIFLIVVSSMISKRSQQSVLEVKRWKAFKNFISDFSAMKDAPVTLLKIWDEYLVYAIALGVAKKLLENIKEISIGTKRPIATVDWYHGLSSMPGRTISPESITGFIDGMSHTVDALSSSTSVGGGFSGGGGGGGGGGGSGAG